MREFKWPLLVMLAAACAADKGNVAEPMPLPVLAGADATDPVRLREIADALGIGMSELEEPVRERGGRDESRVWVLYPRDNVRIDDLGEYRIDVGTEFRAPGKLEFRKGSTLLHSEAFAPVAPSTRAPIPASVRDALAEKGGIVTWGFYPERGRPVTAKFTVVHRDQSLDRRLENLRRRLEGQPPVVQEQLLAQLYLDTGYSVAALEHARRALDLVKDAPQAVAILQAAVRRLDLADTPLWDEVNRVAEGIPPDARKRFGEPRGPARAR